MKIKSINGKNIKGASEFSQRLTLMNVIVGANARGKSRLLDTVRLCLHGHDPVLGPKKSGRLASGNPVVAALEMEDSFSEFPMVRTWKRTPAGMTETAAPQRTLSIHGLLIDFRTFLSMSGPQQLAYVIGQSDLQALGFSKDGLTAEIKSVIPPNPDEATEAATKLIVGDIEAANNESAGKNLNSWLETLLAKLKDRLKIANAELKRLTGSIQTAAQLAEVETARPAATIRSELEGLRAAKQKCEQDLTILQGQLTAWQANEAKRQELQTFLSAPDETTQQIEQAKAEIARLEKLTEGRQRQLTAELRFEFQEIQKKLSAVTAEHKAKREAWNEAAAACDDHAKLWDSECHCCKQYGDKCEGWKRRAVELQDAYGKKETEVENAGALEQQTDENFEQVQDRFQAAHAADAALDVDKELLSEARTKLIDLNEQAKDRTAAQTELGALPVLEEPSKSGMDALELNIGEARQNISKLEAELARSNAEQGRASERAKAVQKQNETKAEAEITALAVKKVEAKQEQLVNDSMTAILKIARLFTDDIIDGELAWRGEIGVLRGGEFISHETFSGVERAIAYIGVAVALSQSSEFKLVMMDELGVVDDKNIGKLMNKIEYLILSGVIQQFIGCDIHNRYRPSDVFSVIDPEA